jgi:hypothetical protein
VQACKQAGAYVVTRWNKPNDLHPFGAPSSAPDHLRRAHRDDIPRREHLRSEHRVRRSLIGAVAITIDRTKIPIVKRHLEIVKVAFFSVGDLE